MFLSIGTRIQGGPVITPVESGKYHVQWQHGDVGLILTRDELTQLRDTITAALDEETP